jgi:N-acetyltransferase
MAGMRPESFRPPVRLAGRYVRLEPLAETHADGLAPIWALPEVHRYLIGLQPNPDRPDVAAMIRRLLQRQSDGTDLAFAAVRISDGRLVGMTCFLNIQRPHNKVEIGSTWFDPSVWRTPIHTESKLLMLRYAFAEEDAHRVILKTDLRNQRTREAMVRLRATEEAVLRQNDWLSEGFYRDTVVFRILQGEWPAIEAWLSERLARPRWDGTKSTGSVVIPGAATLAPPQGVRVDRPETEMGFRSPVTLTGRHVELNPLQRQHQLELERAGRDPAVWQNLRWGNARPVHDLVDGHLTELFEEKGKGEVLPFVIRSLPDRRAVGVFRFLNIDRANRVVELGTWVDSDYWRTPVNTEVKYLALVYAFERELAHRVQMQTDQRNARSQRAIERLGAVREGRHDENMLLPDGTYRTSVVYSILESEWPTVKRGLEQKLARPWPPH